MRKNKNNQAIWGTRIKKSSSTLFQKVGNSIDIDKRLYKEDIQGSIAHVEMLFKQKIISFKIKNKIIYGLNKIEKEISNKKFEFNKKYEDIHMNIEKRLFQIIGDEAGYIHTARSRNDQVITDFKSGQDKIDVIGGVDLVEARISIVDGSSNDLVSFKDNATSFFDTIIKVYVEYDVANLGDALMAIDYNGNGTFDSGDAFVKLIGINESTEILTSDFINL